MPRASNTLEIRKDALKGARIAFTGRLASMSRDDAHALVAACGGQVESSVTRTTTLLVVGMDGWPLLSDGRLSNKLQKAEAAKKRGGKHRLRICSEDQFLESVGRRQPASGMSKALDATQVSELIGVSPETLARWELLGLVRSCEGRYDFRDLVSLQTIATLVSQGASPTTISRSVRVLSKVLPGTERPLAQLKLLAHQDSLIAEVNGTLMTPAGQLLMKFGAEEVPAEAELGAHSLTLQSVLSTGTRSAEDWFEIGCAHEDDGEWGLAESAYREVLKLEPHSSAANFNLANVLKATNRKQAAEERYRVALEHNPCMAEAWLNLADLLDDDGRVDDAVASLQSAVYHAPLYADAHYNLAVILERIGRTDEAQEHWRHYVRLDPASEWGAFARGRLLA